MKRFAVVVLASLLVTGRLSAQDLERLFKAAVNTESVDRNCKAAIEQYKKVAAGTNRALAAQALLQMAGCYQQLGDAEARKTLERIIRDYTDQKDVRAVAAVRLASMPPADMREQGIVAKKILDGPEADVYGSISRDGRYVSFMDPETLDLAVRDLATGEKRRLTTHPVDSRDEFAEYSVFSPDGSRLAYGWSNKDGRYELRTIGREGGTAKLLFSNGSWLMPYDWSPDGREILTLIVREDRTRQIAFVSAADGSVRPLRTLDWNMGVPNHAEYSPDGRFVAYDRDDAASNSDVFVIATDGSREIGIATTTADEGFLGWFPDGRSLLLSSDRTGSTGALAVAVRDGQPQGDPASVKPDIGVIKPYRFTSAGAFVYALRVGVPDVHIATIDSGTGKAIAGPTPLPQRPSGGRAFARWSPDSTRLLYRIAGTMLLGVQDVSSGALHTVPMQLDYAARPSWMPDGMSFLAHGRNLNARKGVFRIDTTGAVESLGGEELGDINQVVMAPDRTAMFYIRFDEQPAGPSSSVLTRRDLSSGAVRDLRIERISSFALSRDGRFLALRITHSDGTRSFEVMSSAGGDSRTVLRESPSEVVWGGGTFSWSPDGKYLFVVRGPVDKSNGRATLGVWRVPVAGGAPEPLDLTAPGINGVDMSPDGRRLAIETLDVRREIWTIQNLPR